MEKNHSETKSTSWISSYFLSPNYKENNCDKLSRWYIDDRLTLINKNSTWYTFVEMVGEVDGLLPDLPLNASSWNTLYEIYGNDIMIRVENLTLRGCRREYCTAFEWEGNSDIAGTGMMATYYIGAVLSSIYVLVLCAEPYMKRDYLRRQCKGPRAIFAVTTAITESSITLLTSMMIFCLAMLFAAMFRYAAAFANIDSSDKAITRYDRICLLFLSIFSCFPPVLLQIIMPPRRRKRLRIGVWVLIIAVSVVVRVLAHKVPDVGDIHFSKNVLWEEECSPDQSDMWRTMRAVEIVTSILFVFWLALKLPWLQRLDSAELYHSIWIRLVAFLSFMGMWVFLGVFTAYRSAMAKSSGNSNKEMAWSFGQVLALATWAPIFVEVAYLSYFGPEEGLEGNISFNYKVVRALDVDEHHDTGLKMNLPLMKGRRSRAEESRNSLNHDSDEEEHLGPTARNEEHV